MARDAQRDALQLGNLYVTRNTRSINPRGGHLLAQTTALFLVLKIAEINYWPSRPVSPKETFMISVINVETIIMRLVLSLG